MNLMSRRVNLHRWVCVVAAIGMLISGCGGSAEQAITDLLELPEETETQTDPVDPIVVTETETTETETTETETPVLNSSLSGRVLDAVSGSPLAGATVSVSIPGVADPVTGVTNTDGTYVISSVAGAGSSVSFTIDGYRVENYAAIDLIADNELNLGTVRLVSEENAGLGTLTGRISNAVDGTGVAGLTLRFRQGINATSGDVVATTTTDANGDYTVTDLPYGNLTCEIVGVGFNTSFANVISLGNIVQSDQNTAVSPNLSSGELRIVLTWGATPSDLDSHLTGPQENSDSPFHVYFFARFSDLVNLDVDDTSSFGPETVTIERQINGVYRYTVYNYSNNNDTELAASGARVQVFDAGGLIRDYQVPDGRGDLWTVFDLEGGNITTVNTISDRTSDAQHFPPSEQAKVVADSTTQMIK